MNRQYLEYSPEVGAPTANSHHGQQHRLQKQPECKAANLSDDHDAENLFSSGGPCRRFTLQLLVAQDTRPQTPGDHQIRAVSERSQLHQQALVQKAEGEDYLRWAVIECRAP
jgi:hypothetical protein